MHSRAWTVGVRGLRRFSGKPRVVSDTSSDLLLVNINVGT